MDSNHRRHCQQIYSLSPLATREFPHIHLCRLGAVGAGGRTRTPDLLITNQLLYQLSYTSKLPAAIIITNHSVFVNTIFQLFTKARFAMTLSELSLQYRETGERCRTLLALQRRQLQREDLTEAEKQLIRRRITMLTAMLRENVALAIRLEKYYGGNVS